MSGEVMLPSQADTPGTLYFLDDSGIERAISQHDLWIMRPDAWSGETEVLDLSNLPTDKWREQGENDE